MIRQIDARYSGFCSCGATVGPEDRIDYDDDTKKIARCVMCGLKDERYRGPRAGRRVGPHAWKVDPGQDLNSMRRYRAREIARYRLYAAKYEARAAAETDQAEAEKLAARAADRRRSAAEAMADASKAGQKWGVPSERDIEFAMGKLEAEIAVAEAERLAEQAGDDDG